MTACTPSLAVVALAGVSNGSQNAGANPGVAIGPGGEAVTGDFYFVASHWTRAAASPPGSPRRTPGLPAPAGSAPPHIAVPWAKAGIIITASAKPGSAYAAVMATPGHGVRISPWPGLDVLAVRAAAALLAGGLVLRLRDA